MGNKGWHNRGYLPHLDGYGITQHVVFRLADALVPGAEPEGDAALDRGHGAAVLRMPACARIVVETLMHFDDARYALRAWCVMPSHVHVLVNTTKAHQIGAVVRTWKSYSARRINALLGARGGLWAVDYFDRFMRDDTHFATTVRYIERNPVAAGLCERPEDWPFSSAGWTE